MKLKNILTKVSIVSMALLMAGTAGMVNAQTQLEGTTDATVTFVDGPLTLNSVTETINFGTDLTITAEAATYQSVSGTPALNVNLTDDRGMSSTLGWALSASLSNFSNNEEPTLEEAFITFGLGEFSSEVTGFTDPTLETDIALTSDDDLVPLASAQRTTEDNTVGIGTWDLTFETATLNVLQNTATAGTHTATITWLLSTAP